MDVKVVTYNVDGLPETLDLNDLPWPLKPVAWVYKLVRGTTVIRVNDGGDKTENTLKISEKLSTLNADIIGVQEDFNYHNELLSSLSTYNTDDCLGKVSFSNVSWGIPPRIDADGVGFLTKGTINDRDIVKWNKSNGYITHANDKLVKKGFRFYSITLNGVDLDVYNLHMDADFYSPDTYSDIAGDIKARKSQLKQLVKYITKRYEAGYTNPIIILGDTNSNPYFCFSEKNIQEYLLEAINKLPGMVIDEAESTSCVDVDRIFYINNVLSPYIIRCKEAHYEDWDMSDHKPFVATLEVLANG